MSQQIELSAPPMRIVSLVPSQTELLFDLGLHDEVIGITKFCIHPDEWFRTKTRIGGTKDLKIDAILALKPDLIIGNKEENTEQQIRQLQETCNVWMSDIHNLEEAITMIRSIGTIVDREARSEEIIATITKGFTAISQRASSEMKRSCVYYIWRGPYMAAGTDTFINDILAKLNLVNVAGDTRYPEVSLEKLREIAPEIVFLSSEPYPFKEKHISEIQQILPHSKIMLVDGEMFSWYGSRLMQAPNYFAELLPKLTNS